MTSFRFLFLLLLVLAGCRTAPLVTADPARQQADLGYHDPLDSLTIAKLDSTRRDAALPLPRVLAPPPPRTVPLTKAQEKQARKTARQLAKEDDQRLKRLGQLREQDARGRQREAEALALRQRQERADALKSQKEQTKRDVGVAKAEHPPGPRKLNRSSLATGPGAVATNVLKPAQQVAVGDSIRQQSAAKKARTGDGNVEVAPAPKTGLLGSLGLGIPNWLVVAIVVGISGFIVHKILR